MLAQAADVPTPGAGGERQSSNRLRYAVLIVAFILMLALTQ